MADPRRIPHFIHGQPRDGTSGRWGEVFDPATGAVQAQVALASADEVSAAVAAAQAAFPAWAATPPLARARVLFRYKALLEQHGAMITVCELQGSHGCGRGGPIF